jgi:hypothetical protein
MMDAILGFEGSDVPTPKRTWNTFVEDHGKSATIGFIISLAGVPTAPMFDLRLGILNNRGRRLMIEKPLKRQRRLC